MKNKPFKPLIPQENKYSMARNGLGIFIISIVFIISSLITGMTKIIIFPLIELMSGNTDPGRAAKALLTGFVFIISCDFLWDKGYEIYKKIKKQGN